MGGKPSSPQAPPPAVRRLLLDPASHDLSANTPTSTATAQRTFVGPDLALDWRGPVVGFYSVVADDGDLYDLNDHYSKPRSFCGVLVRSPVEAFINLAAFTVLLALTIAASLNLNTGAHSNNSNNSHNATVATPSESPPAQHIDWLTTVPKLVHLLFHSGVHVFPNFSPQDGLAHRKCVRIICGIVFGLARYVVMFVYAWRLGVPFFVAQLCVFAVMIRARFFGELVKTAVSYVAVTVAMCMQPGCSGMTWLVLLGTVLQLAGSGCFYLVGQCVGHYYKPWRREGDRRLLPYHVVADLGNALWMVATNYDPMGGAVAAALPFNVGLGARAVFPQCWWG